MKKNKNIFSIKNKVCIVTGGCGGIGSALSKAINQNNGKLIVIDKYIKKIKNVDYYKCDLENKDDVKIVIKRIIKK